MKLNAISATILCACFVTPAWPDDELRSTEGVPMQLRKAFVTSADGPPVLGDWPEAGASLEGLAAGDSICQNLAEVAKLANPEKFVAWLSDNDDDAYCRVHNLTGKIIDNCGQKVLPASAGPWVRTDFTPWASSIGEMLGSNGVVYTTLDRSETGAVLTNTRPVFTATNHLGRLQSVDGACTDWTGTPSSNVGIGGMQNTTQGWTIFTNRQCSDPSLMAHLFCLETEPGLGLALPTPGDRLVFVTSVSDDGALGDWDDADPGTSGIEAGDSICNNLAQAAGLPWAGYYKAWLSDATTDAGSRFVSDGPWHRLDGFEVASSYADLVDGSLQVPINVDENLNYWGNFVTWTGTFADGTKTLDTCNSWASTGLQGVIGRMDDTSARWSYIGPSDCSQTNRRLYCFDDRRPGLLSEDGFETR